MKPPSDSGRAPFTRHVLWAVLAATILPSAAAQTATVSPTGLTFLTQVVGTTSAAKTATLTNTGSVSLNIASIQTTGDFAQTNNCGSSLAGGAKCTINVTFTPTAMGRRTGTLSVNDNASSSPQMVSLSGSGTIVSLTPSTLSFGNVGVGIASPPQTVTLTNVGTTSLNVTGVSIVGTNAGDFTQTNTCGSLVAASASCTIMVTFKPAATGSRRATLNVSDNGGASPQTVAISGTGTTMATLVSIAVTPNNPSVAAGVTQQFTATGTYSDGSTQNLTTTATWTSSNTAVATISNTSGSQGLATSLAQGTSTITATSFSISGSTVLTVTPTIGVGTPVTTWHYDNGRTSANTSELLLTPSNVNSGTFGELFTQPVDGFVVGHPLYLPGISIPGQGTHNVVYVATMHDSVYAFDADNPNAAPLWMTSILTYSPTGATSVPTAVQNNGPTTGWTEVGIISTPVIDPVSGTLYVVAETYENGNVVHRLHALDVSSGQEKLGGPTTIAATYTLNGITSTFSDLYQINRPGLLLANGHIYIAFGSNCCNAYSQGWVMSYNASTLQQEGAFDAEPGKTLASVWQTGAGISADASGNIYAETGEGFYAPGTNLSESVFKLSQIGTTLSLADWFTPFNYQYLSNHDLDMAEAVLILPDQPGPFPHELIAIGKLGTVYVLNRDNMGQLCSACTTIDTQIVQELPTAVGLEGGTPVYWNNTVYFTGQSLPIMAYTLSNGLLVVPPTQSKVLGNGGHALITANGNSNGILWNISGGNTLWAMDATTLQVLYTSNQATNGRDKLPPLAHFATFIAADGKVFVGTQNSLIVYGLF